MKKNVRLFLLALLAFFSQPVFAQGGSAFQETMRSNGRIYVVVAVIVTILAGLILYLIRLDRRIGRLEKESNRS